MSNSIMRDKAKEFAIKIVFLCRKMKELNKEAVLVNQLLRCGTSIGANIHEAQYGQSPKDFYQSLKLLKKSAMKPSIGLNCCSKQSVWMKRLIK